MSIFFEHTRFHGEYPVKVFLKMWGVFQEDISEPLRTITKKNRPSSGRGGKTLENQAEMGLHRENMLHRQEPIPGTGADINDVI